MVSGEAEKRRVGVNTVGHILSVRKGMSERYLEEKAGQVHALCHVYKLVYTLVIGIVHVRYLVGGNVACRVVCEVRAVTRIVELSARDYFLAVIGDPRLALASVDSRAVEGIAIGYAVIVTRFSVVVIKRAVVGN